MPAAVRVLRPQQWVKNGLLFLPSIAAHASIANLDLLLGFIAFCAAASAGYVLNDLMDVTADQAHPYKKQRVIASGELIAPAAYFIAIAAVIVAIVLSVRLPERFQLTLLIYLLLNVLYSGTLKRVVFVDVLLLTTLYSSRLVAGSVLADVPLTRWFLALSTFFFLSLALCKRVVELEEMEATETGRRGYIKDDLAVMIPFGVASSIAAALVYCLYITGTEAQRLYSRPDLLWAGLPILIYWQARVWLLVGRKKMHTDPVVFALTDMPTYGLVLAFGVLLWLAS